MGKSHANQYANFGCLPIIGLLDDGININAIIGINHLNKRYIFTSKLPRHGFELLFIGDTWRKRAIRMRVPLAKIANLIT